MVYRGKPSAGCENCRKAKKRCGLELPACERCVKLKKTCSGYRDTTALQIQDESESVKLKAEKHRPKPAPPPPSRQRNPVSKPTSPPPKVNSLAPPTITETLAGIPTPGSIHSESTSSSDSTIDLERDFLETPWSPGFLDFNLYDPLLDDPETWLPALTYNLGPKPDDLAATYFFNQFTADNQWQFMRTFAAGGKQDPCLDLAIKACGMAALGNIECIARGNEYARSMYTAALGMLNEALRDPVKSKTDESLIAVAMLGRYENIVCEGRDSIQSWKAHVAGSTQLLKVRGKAQFKTDIGRIMFREVRNQALVASIWADASIPQFLRDYQEELDKYADNFMAKPADDLAKICWDMADLRASMRALETSYIQAAEQASQLERRFIQWEVNTSTYHERWRYTVMEVEDSEHVWDGRVHSYSGLPAPTVWNTYRNMRIMLTKTQEWLCDRLKFSEEEREEQSQYFRQVRRQLTDEICATIPVALGHASPVYSSPCVLVTAYGAIWPLFFAGLCAIERVGPGAWSIVGNRPLPPGQVLNKAGAQAQWILNRLEYISKIVGVKWADGVVAEFRAQLKIPRHMRDQSELKPVGQDPNPARTRWLRQIEDAADGERHLLGMPDSIGKRLEREEARAKKTMAWVERQGDVAMSDVPPRSNLQQIFV
jgi:hypothetical protein